MTGIATNKKHGLLKAGNGIELTTFDSAKELAEAAIRSTYWEFESTEQLVQWLNELGHKLLEDERLDAINDSHIFPPQ